VLNTSKPDNPYAAATTSLADGKGIADGPIQKCRMEDHGMHTKPRVIVSTVREEQIALGSSLGVQPLIGHKNEKSTNGPNAIYPGGTCIEPVFLGNLGLVRCLRPKIQEPWRGTLVLE